MEVLRTPDERFAGLDGWDIEPRYAIVGSGDEAVRMAYVDMGPPLGRPVVLLHGEPTWSYLYRFMIPPLTAAGLRVIAPDNIGFGRSDKPLARGDHTYGRHVGWLTDLMMNHLDLRDIVLFCQDWGGLLGLRILGEHTDRFAGAVASNTMLPTGDHPLGEGFLQWREFSQATDDLPVGAIVNAGASRSLRPAELAAYDAPFPDVSYKAAVMQFPLLVPATPNDPAAADNRAAWAGLEGFRQPFVCAFGDADPVTAGGDRVLRRRIPGADGQPHQLLPATGHFSQEDASDQLAGVILELVGRLG